MGIERHPGVRPPEGMTNREVTTVGEMEHFKGECPKYLGSPNMEKRVSFQETKGALNYKRATHEA